MFGWMHRRRDKKILAGRWKGGAVHINPDGAGREGRNSGRIERLRLAINDAKTSNESRRIFQAELRQRLEMERK